jgi:lipoprotein-anchoring transpeptidase ErfK/SrfK
MVSGSTTLGGSTAAAVASPTPPSPYSIEIDLGEQRAYLLKNGRKFAESPISSGREGHLTPTGNFEVIEKDLNHFSNLYGKIVETKSGRVVKEGADSAMPVPKGCKFVPAPMKWFMRFDGAAGMHAGILPGYAASHGCVRMPASKAELFFGLVEVGTPVHVFGTPPARMAQREAPEPRRESMASAKTPSTAPQTPPRRPRHGQWWL